MVEAFVRREHSNFSLTGTMTPRMMKIWQVQVGIEEAGVRVILHRTQLRRHAGCCWRAGTSNYTHMSILITDLQISVYIHKSQSVFGNCVPHLPIPVTHQGFKYAYTTKFTIVSSFATIREPSERVLLDMKGKRKEVWCSYY